MRTRTALRSLVSTVATLAAVAALPLAAHAADPSLVRVSVSDLQRRTGAFVATTCDGLAARGVSLTGSSATSDLFARCTDLVVDANNALGISGGMGMGMGMGAGAGGAGLSEAELIQALVGIANDESSAQGTSSTQTAVPMIQTVSSRLYALREGGPAISLAGFRMRDREGNVLDGADLEQALAEHAAAGDADAGLLGRKIGVFVNGLGAWGDFDGDSNEAGYDFDTYGVIAGVDYRFTDNFVAGVAGGWSTTDQDFDRSGGDQDLDTWSGSLYATYQLEGFYTDAIVTYSNLDFDLDRRIRYPTVNRTASSSTDGDEWAASLGTGYSFTSGAWSYGPHVRVNYVDTDIDGYTESGAFGLDLRVDDQDVRSLTTDLGANVSYAVSTGFGVLTPYARGEWEHEFEDDARSITARFVADPNQTRLVLRTSSPDRNYFRVGTGVAATFAEGMSAFVDFETVLGLRDIDVYAVTLGARYQF